MAVDYLGKYGFSKSDQLLIIGKPIQQFFYNKPVYSRLRYARRFGLSGRSDIDCRIPEIIIREIGLFVFTVKNDVRYHTVFPLPRKQ